MKRIFVLALCVALAACAKTPQGEPAAAPGVPAPVADAADMPATAAATDASVLTANHWQLRDAKDAQGQRIDALFVNADKPLQLDFADGRVSVSNSCNSMGAAYAVQADQLTIQQVASTQMACADAKLMALDQEAGKRLQGATRFAQRNDMLTLTTASGDVLTFHGKATAATRYGGEGETVFLEVAAQTRACSHPLIADNQCLQVRELKYDVNGLKSGSNDAFANFYAPIEGYQHQPGTRNVLRVKRYAVKNPPADGSSLAYELDMVVESESVKP